MLEIAGKNMVFGCPHCGCREYVEVWMDNDIVGSDFLSTLLFCKCKDCTAIFFDPGSFSSAPYLKAKRCDKCHKFDPTVKIMAEVGEKRCRNCQS